LRLLGSPRYRTLTTVTDAAAAAMKTSATKSTPLPKNTVAKNRSSRSPIWSRMTARNQRNMIPENGAR
jgi:hypothetical protein